MQYWLSPLKLLPDIKRVQIIDFLDVDLRHVLADFTYVVQKVTAGIALKVRHHTLLVRRCVEIPCQLAVEPRATAALEGVAVTAQRRVVESQKLLVRDVQTVFQIADRVIR